MINRKFITFIVACVISLSAQLSHGENINVAVAANFKHTLQALKAPFEDSTPHTINIISASTGQLMQQISQHAPFDVFLAANTAHPQLLWQHIHEERQLELDALIVYAKGRLVFYSNFELPSNLSLAQAIKDERFKRLSVANARLAPYGDAAQQTLKCLGAYTQWQSKLIVGQNVAQAFQFIDSKNVDGGFVALSQVLNKNQQQLRIVDETCYKDINQMALRLNNKAASVAFMTFLKSATARSIIEQHGYRLP